MVALKWVAIGLGVASAAAATWWIATRNGDGDRPRVFQYRDENQ